MEAIVAASSTKEIEEDVYSLYKITHTLSKLLIKVIGA